VQVKYEMIRSVKNNECSAKEAAEQFGFSRVSYYKIKNALDTEGLQSLIPKKRGPQAGHKLTPQIEDYIKNLISNNTKMNAQAVVDKVKSKFSVELHTRTVYRYLSRLKKNGQPHGMKKK
jgi:transposase